MNAAIGQLAQPCIDIAAQRHHVQIRALVEQLRLSTQAGRADGDAFGQIGQTRFAIARDQHVARVLPFQQGAQHDPVGQDSRHILHRMDRKGGATIQLGFVDLLGEEALAARFDQGAVLDAVAGRDKAENGEAALSVLAGQAALRGEFRLHIAGLDKGQG